MTENLGPKNIQQIIEEKAGDKKEALIRQIKEKYGEDRLTLTLETAEEIAQAEQEVMQMAEKWTEDPAYLGKFFDSVARKEQAEDEINKLPGVKEKLDGIEKVEDLATLSVDVLIKLEDHYPGILLYAFTDITDGKQKLDFANWQGYSNILPGTKFQVDFRGNPQAEAEIGAGELLPPSVRSMVVYENGDEGKARISKRRIGLKSRNDDAGGASTGFFDENGYIPIYTDDVIEINGSSGAKVIDKGFEDRFIKEADGGGKALDFEGYNKSEEAKGDEQFLQKLFKVNPMAQRRKIMTTEEIDALQSSIEASGKGARVVEAALAVVKGNSIMAAHCWDFVNKVYGLAGAGARRIYQDLNYSGKDCGEHHAGPAMMARISPGDWLYYNNKNNADRKGCHSGIFMGWIDEGQQVARICSWNGKRKQSRIHEADLKAKPVTHITKPV